MRRPIAFLDPLILGVILGMVFVAMTHSSASLFGRVALERGWVRESSTSVLSAAGSVGHGIFRGCRTTEGRVLNEFRDSGR